MRPSPIWEIHLLKYIHLAILLVAVFLPDQLWASPTLAAINAFFALFFYWLCFGLLTGLKISTLNDDIDVAEALTNKMIQVTSTIFLFSTGDLTYQLIAAFTAPWVITNTITDIFSTLVKWEILEIREGDSEE